MVTVHSEWDQQERHTESKAKEILIVSAMQS